MDLPTPLHPPPRARERLWRYGPDQLSDAELLAVVLGTGVRGRPALAVAGDLLAAVGGVAAIGRAAPAELAAARGIGAARAARLAAGFALGRRGLEPEARPIVADAATVYRMLRPRVAGLAQEVFVALGLDVRNGLVGEVEVARGLLTGVEVHPREVFRPLIRMAAAGAVVAHNHPSGDPTPSAEDLALTRRLRAVGELVGIPIVDHVVLGRDSFRSIAEWLGTEL